MKTILIATFTSLIVATTGFAQKATIAGYALGAQSRPLPNAEIRVQQQNAKTPAVVVRSNAKGAYVARDLAVGDYTVSIHTADGTAASVVRVRTKPNETARVDFLPQQSVAAAAKRRARWVPPPTGSHMGGFDDAKYKTSAQEEGYGGQNVGRLSPTTLGRMQSTTQNIRPGGG